MEEIHYKEIYKPTWVEVNLDKFSQNIKNIKNKGKQLLVGTGESDKIIDFYKKFGFKYSHTIKNFFIDNYDHKMYENGIQLKDMIYLKIDF